MIPLICVAISLVGADAKFSALVPKGDRAAVLFFVSRDCPISNAYAPEFNRIAAAYSGKKIGFEVVYTDSDASKANSESHAKEHGYHCLVAFDSQHRLVKEIGATVTPEVALLSSDGKLVYRGRIDDTYASFGVRRFHPTSSDLRDALAEFVSGRPIKHDRTTPIGCFIPE